MIDYEIVAFYRRSETEISVHAERVGRVFGLGVRYEKAPSKASAIVAMFDDKSVFCMFNWDYFGKYKLMLYVYNLLRPCLIVRDSWSTDAYMHLKIPVGYLQENKEKVVWANFLQKYNPALDIELLVPKESDSEIISMVDSNLEFIRNILDHSKATYKETHGELGSGDHLRDIFKKTDNGVVLIMRSYRLFSFYFPFRIRMFLDHGHTPTLIIPRDEDLYIPCH